MFHPPLLLEYSPEKNNHFLFLMISTFEHPIDMQASITKQRDHTLVFSVNYLSLLVKNNTRTL